MLRTRKIGDLGQWTEERQEVLLKSLSHLLNLQLFQVCTQRKFNIAPFGMVNFQGLCETSGEYIGFTPPTQDATIASWVGGCPDPRHKISRTKPSRPHFKCGPTSKHRTKTPRITDSWSKLARWLYLGCYKSNCNLTVHFGLFVK